MLMVYLSSALNPSLLMELNLRTRMEQSNFRSARLSLYLWHDIWPCILLQYCSNFSIKTHHLEWESFGTHLQDVMTGSDIIQRTVHQVPGLPNDLMLSRFALDLCGQWQCSWNKIFFCMLNRIAAISESPICLEGLQNRGSQECEPVHRIIHRMWPIQLVQG